MNKGLPMVHVESIKGEVEMVSIGVHCYQSATGTCTADISSTRSIYKGTQCHDGQSSSTRSPTGLASQKPGLGLFS